MDRGHHADGLVPGTCVPRGHPRVRPARRTPRGAGGPHRVAESLHGGDVRSVDRRGRDDEKRGLNASASRTRTLPPWPAPAREPVPPHPRRQGPVHRDLDRPGVHERPSGRDRGGRWIHRRGRLHLLGLECDREQRATASGLTLRRMMSSGLGVACRSEFKGVPGPRAVLGRHEGIVPSEAAALTERRAGAPRRRPGTAPDVPRTAPAGQRSRR